MGAKWPLDHKHRGVAFAYDWLGPYGPIPNGVPAELITQIGELEQVIRISPELQSRMGVCNSHLRSLLVRAHFPFAQVPTCRGGGHRGNPHIFLLEPFGDPLCFLGRRPPSFTRSALDYVSKIALERIRSGEYELWINFSQEGSSVKGFAIPEIHACLREFGIPLSQTTFLCGNLHFEANYERWAKSADEPERMRVFAWPYMLFFCDLLYAPSRTDPREFVQPGEPYESVRPKHFLSLNRRPHPPRMALAALLLQSGLSESGFLSFGGSPDPGASGDPSWTESRKKAGALIDPQHPLADNLKIGLDLLTAQAPLTVDKSSFESWLLLPEGTADLYRQTYFSIVTETLFYSTEDYLLSEKTLKPILNLHPFILIAAPGSLHSLKKLGFRTFTPWIDERYDTITNHAERFLAAYEEIRRLCSLSLAELTTWYTELRPTLEHNLRRFDTLAKSPLFDQMFPSRAVS